MNMPPKVMVDHLRELMTTMYPDTDERLEHPMTAVGTVLLAAAIFGIIEEQALVRFTGYPKPFVSAILFNLQANRALKKGSYDCTEWFSSDGAIDGAAFWDHIEAACGDLWLQEGDFDPLDTCQIYWNNKKLS